MSRIKQYAIAIGLVVALFVVMGIGLGLSGYIAVDYAESSFTSDDPQRESGMQQGIASLFVALILFQSVIVAFFAGPLVASTVGITSGVVTPDVRDGALVGGVGSFVGFYPMVLLAVLIMVFAVDTGSSGGGSSGGSSFDIAGAIVPMLFAGVPAGLVGAGAGALGSKL